MTRPFPPSGDLEAALRSLAGELVVPVPSPGFAAIVRERCEAVGSQRRSWWARAARRSLLAAVALLLIVVAVAAAVGLGLPGIRIFFGPPPSIEPTASASGLPGSSAAPGAGMGLGVAVPLTETARVVGFEPRLPAAGGLGEPAAAFVAEGRLSLVWIAGPDLPAVRAGSAVGLLVTEFRGEVDPGWYEKVLSDSGNTLEPVSVAGHDGYWITGDPHTLVYRAADGTSRGETRRMVGDVLIWSDGELTYRLETSLGRNAAITLAESMRQERTSAAAHRTAALRGSLPGLVQLT